VGATVLYKAPFSERYGVVFFGVGGGLFIARGTRIPVYDIAGNVIDTISNSVTDPMITAGGGLTLDLSDTIGFFVQGRWFRAFTSGSKNEMSAHLGLSFQLGDE
jgi:hypothetical protein